MIRYTHERRESGLDRVHLYFDWPAMQGYRPAARNIFNYTLEEGSQNILFATIEPHLTLRDMSDRFEPIYSRLVASEPIAGIRGLLMYRFKPELREYAQEILVYGEREDAPPFIALCLKGAWARETLTSCTRDVRLSEKLTISYQFSNAMLMRWPEMEDAVLRTASSFLPINELGLR
ncbi:hypothetical protein [Limoniibacter endophyticus]|uniref:Uncharacterized protein n=1 Tax=Limoniibacter endophyticus TaxID=1565040 RepID=A0A8J3DLZ5_9HYPH|nr:hypothetical protein [Limoniibacter endophyticus]GHC61987.1 hypothetical protein GCM10010136_02920 [Limoniibacter endophyticus]